MSAVAGITYAGAYDQLRCDYALGLVNKTARLAFFLFATGAFLWKTGCDPDLKATGIWFGANVLVIAMADFLDALVFEHVAGFPGLEKGQGKSDPLTAKQVRQIQDSWIWFFLTGHRQKLFFKKLDLTQVRHFRL